jgi:predicted 3-demethylubiquinone-9 3-methyltransferase (glyoxalase superfamily)
MAKITPCLWFDTQAEEAANFYVSIFKNSSIIDVMHFPEGSPPSRTPGMVMMVTFTIDGSEIQALNGGPEFKFTPAISLFVKCESQEEIDYVWERLSGDGGSEGMCGWLSDKFGVSWQFTHRDLDKYLVDPDPEKSKRVMQALHGMKKIVMADLQAAYNGV